MATTLTRQNGGADARARGGAVRRTRLLGFVPAAGLPTLRPALDNVNGPPLAVIAGPDIVALVQPEPATPLLGRGRAALLAELHTVQRRLEIACQAGDFLAMDPAAACCPAEVVADMLAAAWPGLVSALAAHGRRQQWDILLRWSPEVALAPQRDAIAQTAGPGRAGLAAAVAAALRDERARREAALLAALKPAVLAFAPAGAATAETEVALIALLPSGGEAAVERALEGLAPEHAEGATLDMRGPLPPLSFFPVRLARVEAGALALAWRRLDLPARIDLPGLHRQWRLRAFALHPDRNAAAAGFANALSDVTASYHLLRDLMRDAQAPDWTLAELSRHAGYRLILPSAPEHAQTAAAPLSDATLELQGLQ